MATPLPEPLQTFDPLAVAVDLLLRRIDELAADYRARRDAGRVLPNVIEAMRIELTYSSNAIEGNTLTLRETQLVIEGQTPDASHSMHELYEARNHDRALRMIEQWVAARSPDEPITERDVLDVHARVMADIDPRIAGRYRTDRVLIAGSHFVPPGGHRFDALMPRLLEMANRSDVHPALQAAEFHYNLVAIHPFADGNGRTARLMMNHLLLRHGFPLTVIAVAERAAYLSSLDRANAGDIEPFARFVLASIERSIRRLIDNGDPAPSPRRT